MRVLPGVLLAVLFGLTAAAGADDAPDFQARLQAALAGLGAPRAPRRQAALARMGGLVREDAAACRRAVRPLGDVARRRGPDQAAEAVRLLARIPDERARFYWLRALDPDLHPKVYLAAVDAAAHRRHDAEAHKALLALARDGRADPAVRALAVEALGAAGGTPARLLLTRPLAAEGIVEPWLLAAARAVGLGRLGGEAVLGPLIELLDHPERAPRVHAWEALVLLTRQVFPAEAGPWRDWYAKRKKSAPPEAAPAEPVAPVSEASPDDRYTAPAPVHVPHYYGIPIDRPRSRVVFCLDVSQSMYGRGIRQARGELEQTLKDFPATYAFDIVAFNEKVMPYAGELLPAHPVVKQNALRWLEAMEPTSYTNLYDAVETAFGHTGLDAVFLLSDGAPNRGRHRQDDRVVEAIARLSEKRVPVHAVAAGEEVFPLLKRIAEATGGRFVDAFEFD